MSGRGDGNGSGGSGGGGRSGSFFGSGRLVAGLSSKTLGKVIEMMIY